MTTTYDVLHVDTTTGARAAGLIAIADLPELDALRVAATRRHAIDAREGKDGKVTDADARAVAAWRGLILRLTERQGATASHAMLKGITPTFLRHVLAQRGGLAFACPLTGTYVLAPTDHAVSLEDATTSAADARERAEAARPGLIAATRQRLEIAA